MQKILYAGLSWGAFESLTVQSLLALHNTLLLSTIGPEHFGIIGVLYSLIYVLASIATVGFDSTCATMLTSLTSFSDFRAMVKSQCLLTLCIVLLGLFTIFLFFTPPSLINKSLLLMTSIGILIGETIKKMAKSLLGICGDFKTGAVTECWLTCWYTITIWSIYIFLGSLSLESIMIPLCLYTFVCAGYLWYRVSCLEAHISLSGNGIDKKTGLSMRLSTFIMQGSWYLFSWNTLVIGIAWIFGYSTAALIKLIGMYIHISATCLEKMFGITSTTLFTHAATNKKSIFLLIIWYLTGSIVFSCFLGLISMYVFLPAIESSLLFFVFSYTLIRSIHLFCIVCERLLIDTKQTATISLLLGSTLTIPLLFWYFLNINPQAVFISMIISRIIYGLGIIGYAVMYSLSAPRPAPTLSENS